ncbi:hypothetical protein pipiens_007146 [Culex pipiens pipiens]|uniref:NADH dehydrogenase [ubiquinone] flavoprotein 3, mitochondrial n=1 Tax=Culex pipiens pipiens TaxID=38569 RepID=A0ABD1DQV9_CULPP
MKHSTKPSARNRPKTENFKSYESLGKIKQPIWREQLPTERGLGPIADDCPKESSYKNPEYFSYHNYTFYNLAMAMQCMYQPQPSALEDRDLAEQTTKSCYVVEVKPWDDGSGKKNPPPRCVEDDCGEDSKDGKDDGEARDEKSNLYATKPAARNRPKTENFKSYESLGKIKQPIWRKQLPTERSLGPIAAECPKESSYKNPEYFSYHNYTFYNLAMAMQCMYQPQPSALEDRDLAEQTTKSCYVVEVKPWDDGSGKKNPPPSCVEDDCGEDSKEGKGSPEACARFLPG